MTYKTKDDFQKFIKKVKDKKKLQSEDFKSFLIKAAETYYNKSEELVSDADFDLVRDEFENKYPNDPYFSEVGAEPTLNQLFKKEAHTSPMGSLQKTPSFDELLSWAEKNGPGEDLVCSEKIDGLSVDLTYENGLLVKALTRGNGIQGENITQNVMKMILPKTVPVKETIKVRGEIVLKKSLFNLYFKDKGMANARNAAVGAVKRLNGEGCEHLTVLCYNLFSDGLDFDNQSDKILFLKDKLKLDTPAWSKVKIKEVKDIWTKYENSLRDQSDFEMDGLVIEFDRLDLHTSLGYVANRPKFAKALKFTSADGETILRSVVRQVGRTGKLTPVGTVDPIVLAGATITKVSLHNEGEIKRLGLKIGQTVKIRRSGDVIPQIVGVVNDTGTEILVPDTCPSCGQKVVKDEILKCKNKHCPDQVYLSLLFWMQCLEVKGFGDELVRQLFESKKVKTIDDFYTLDVNDISELEKRGEKTAIKVLKELNSKRELTLPDFIKGLGIDNIGKSTSELVLEKYKNLANIRKVTSVEELVEIDGIGEITAKSLIDGLVENSDLIDRLLTHVTIKEVKENKDGKFFGLSFCFSGFRDEKLAKLITEEGGKLANGVNKSLSYLVLVDKESSSEKSKKAKEYGIKILDKADLSKMLE
jgi:DNA ligase (NAD+)